MARLDCSPVFGEGNAEEIKSRRATDKIKRAAEVCTPLESFTNKCNRTQRGMTREDTLACCAIHKLYFDFRWHGHLGGGGKGTSFGDPIDLQPQQRNSLKARPVQASSESTVLISSTHTGQRVQVAAPEITYRLAAEAFGLVRKHALKYPMYPGIGI